MKKLIQSLTGNGTDLPDLNPDESESQTAIAEAMRAAALSQPQHGDQPELDAPTPQQMASLMLSAVEDIGRAFTLEVERVKVEHDQETGVVVGETRQIINRLGFFQKTVLGTIVWKLERLAAEMDDPKNYRGIPAQELQIRRSMERVSRDESIEVQLNRQIDWLEVLCEQRACLANAILAAKEGYEHVIGQPYDKPEEVPVSTVEVAAAPASPATASERAKARLAGIAR